MKRFFVIFWLAIAIVGFSSESFALSAMKGMFGKGDKSATAPASADQLLNSFMNAQIKVMVAQEKLAVAYGMKEQSDLLRLQIDALSSSALDSEKNSSGKSQEQGKVNLDEVKKSIEISNAAQTQIDQYIEQDRQLDPKSKKAYSEGVAAYVIAVKDAYLFLNAVKAFGTDTSASGLMGKARGAQTVIFVTKSTPAYLKNFFDSTKKVFAYAKKQKIEVPQDATSMLDG